MKRVGVDVGGTFTDLILVDEESRRITVDKVPSTPEDPARGVVEGVHELCEKGDIALDDVDGVLHGTTVATNIVLTHTGAEVGMITTEGFRDILHIARHRKPYSFSLQQELPWQSRPLVKRRHRLTVGERVTVPDGEVLIPLDDEEVRERVRALRDAGVEAVAVCLLHSYLNPAHEQRVKQIVEEEFPDAFLSVSSDVLPLYREFERFSTVCLNAYVGPIVARYLERFDEALRSQGFKREVQLRQSSGGMATLESGAERPVTLMMSGPVAGLIGGIWAGRQAGFADVITLDMAARRPTLAWHQRAGSGCATCSTQASATTRRWFRWSTSMRSVPVAARSPTSTTAASSGSGRSPREPTRGRRVTGRGGSEPTSTDAQLVLGRLRPDRGLLGGAMQLDEPLARDAIETVANQLGISVEEAALGALQIQKFGMTQAIELNSVRRGYDPRDFTLVAAGGRRPAVRVRHRPGA